MRVIDIAKVCHQVNKAYCESLGDISQLDWDNAPGWQRESAVKGVEFHIANPDSKPSDSHNSWLKDKVESGWVFGQIKNPETKEHPCCVPYESLPKEQQAKDFIFLTIVRELESYLDVYP